MRLLHKNGMLVLGEGVLYVSVKPAHMTTIVYAYTLTGKYIEFEIKHPGISCENDRKQKRMDLAREIAINLGTDAAFEVDENLTLRKLSSEDKEVANLGERVARRDELVFKSMAARDAGDHATADDLLRQAKKAMRGEA